MDASRDSALSAEITSPAEPSLDSSPPPSPFGPPPFTEETADPSSTFYCVTLKVRGLRRSDCVARQVAVHPRAGPVFPICGSGKCEQGKLVALGLGSWKPPPYRTTRLDWQSQIAAKTRQKKSGQISSKWEIERGLKDELK